MARAAWADWLRVWGTMMVVVYHALRFYDVLPSDVKANVVGPPAFGGNDTTVYIVSDEGLAAYTRATEGMAQWLMPMFFALSGLATGLAQLQASEPPNGHTMQPIGRVMLQRTRSLLLPLIVGTCTSVLVARFIVWRFRHAAPGFVRFAWEWFTCQGESTLTIDHLWYLIVLWAILILATPWFHYLRWSAVAMTGENDVRKPASALRFALIYLAVATAACFAIATQVDYAPVRWAIRIFLPLRFLPCVFVLERPSLSRVAPALIVAWIVVTHMWLVVQYGDLRMGVPPPEDPKAPDPFKERVLEDVTPASAFLVAMAFTSFLTAGHAVGVFLPQLSAARWVHAVVAACVVPALVVGRADLSSYTMVAKVLASDLSATGRAWGVAAAYAWCAVLFGAAAAAAPALSTCWGALRWCKNVSFTIYVYHPMFLYAASVFYRNTEVWPTGSHVFRLVTTTALGFLGPLAIYRWCVVPSAFLRGVFAVDLTTSSPRQRTVVTV